MYSGGQVDGIIIACNYGKSNDFGRHRSSVTTSVQRSILEKYNILQLFSYSALSSFSILVLDVQRNVKYFLKFIGKI